jgi:hypothetical protein
MTTSRRRLSCHAERTNAMRTQTKFYCWAVAQLRLQEPNPKKGRVWLGTPVTFSVVPEKNHNFVQNSQSGYEICSRCVQNALRRESRNRRRTRAPLTSLPCQQFARPPLWPQRKCKVYGLSGVTFVTRRRFRGAAMQVEVPADTACRLHGNEQM